MCVGVGVIGVIVGYFWRDGFVAFGKRFDRFARFVFGEE